MDNRDTPISDADLVTFLFDETPEPERTQVQQAVDTEADLSERLRVIQSGLAAIELDADLDTLGRDFNVRLRSAHNADTGVDRPQSFTTAARNNRRWMRWSLPLAAAAAVALLLTTAFPIARPNGTGVVWAEVAEMVQSVPQFRMTVFGSDPESMFEDLRLFHLDLYYREPDGWRTHGWGQVCFHSAGELSLYEDETGEPIENTRTALASMTRDIAEAEAGVLNAILNELFNDAPPPGEPVRSDTVTAQAGIDVFDYVGDPTQRRARVWVVRESRLPLKIHIYTAGTDDFSLVSFDYSDPKPADFFDHGFYYEKGDVTPR